jgi:hypothetical protein
VEKDVAISSFEAELVMMMIIKQWKHYDVIIFFSLLKLSCDDN